MLFFILLFCNSNHFLDVIWDGLLVSIGARFCVFLFDADCCLLISFSLHERRQVGEMVEEEAGGRRRRRRRRDQRRRRRRRGRRRRNETKRNDPPCDRVKGLQWLRGGMVPNAVHVAANIKCPEDTGVIAIATFSSVGGGGGWEALVILLFSFVCLFVLFLFACFFLGSRLPPCSVLVQRRRRKIEESACGIAQMPPVLCLGMNEKVCSRIASEERKIEATPLSPS